MTTVQSLLTSPIFLSAFFSWITAQVLKVIIEIMLKKSTSSKDMFVTVLWKTGGMPSSHSSMVTALATSVGFIEGIGSPIFIVTFFYALVTIRDALGVRRATGIQARSLNLLNRELNKHFRIPMHPVKEVHGHTIAEVSVGILLGFFLAVAFCIL